MNNTEGSLMNKLERGPIRQFIVDMMRNLVVKWHGM